jgi:hypothetical protein
VEKQYDMVQGAKMDAIQETQPKPQKARKGELYVNKEPWTTRKERSCIWDYNESHCFWNTSCNQGAMLDIEGPFQEQFGWVFCPWCGRRIKIFGTTSSRNKKGPK